MKFKVNLKKLYDIGIRNLAYGGTIDSCTYDLVGSLGNVILQNGGTVELNRSGKSGGFSVFSESGREIMFSRREARILTKNISMKKTRKPINGTGKNSYGNNRAENSPTKNSPSNNSRKKLVSQNMLLQFVKAEFACVANLIHTNFFVIMGMFIGVNLGFLFINDANRIHVTSIFICLFFVSFRQYADRQEDKSTLDKFASFKRFTHKRANGRIDIKQDEIEQIIIYLYELEEYMGKPDKEE